MTMLEGNTRPSDRRVTTAEAATILRTSRPYVTMLCNAGKLGTVEMTEGGHRRISLAAVEQYRLLSISQNMDAPTVREAGIAAGLYEQDDSHYSNVTPGSPEAGRAAEPIDPPLTVQPPHASAASTTMGSDDEKPESSPGYRFRPSEIDRKSLALHRLVVQKIRRQPWLFDRVHGTLTRWFESADLSACVYLVEWQRHVGRGMEHALAVAVEDSERGRVLRTSSPFTSILTTAEREDFLNSWSIGC